MRGPVRRALVLATAAALTMPAAATAESALWTLTASPLAATTGVQTTFSLTATNEDPVAALSSNNEIGCVVLDVPPNFSVKSAAVVGSNAGEGWHVDRLEGNRVFVHTDSGGDRLELLQWVRFTVTATATSTGSLGWPARAYRDTGCTGTGAVLGVPPVVIVSGATVTPTPAPTATPAPTPTPTPLLPLPSASIPLPMPSVGVLPTPTPTPTPATTPARAQTPAPTPTPTGSATTGVSSAGPTPSESTTPEQVPPSPGEPTGAGGGATRAGAADRGTLQFARVEFDAGGVQLELGSLDVILGAPTWAVPAATIAAPGLLLLILVALQSVGAFAWIPAVRRLRGDDEDRS